MSTLHAQLVADGATNTLSSVTNSIAGNVFVGTNAPFTLLVLSNNCLLTNSATGYIGFNATARSNEARLISGSARWFVGGGLVIGYNGGFNRLTISNGARVTCSFGELAGNSTGASNNTVVVTGAGSVWSSANNLNLGNLAGGNRLEISDGGWVGNHDGTMSFGISNRILVTGAGSVWTNRNDLILGLVRGGSQLVVSNGGKVFNRIGYLGQLAGGSNNLALVTGSGSVWANSSDLYVGMADKGNQLVVSNGATVTAGNVFVGFNNSATNNRVTLDGGTLQVTNASATGMLDVRRGTNVLNAGLIEADRLLVTNTAGRFEFNGGTLSTRDTIVNNGQPFRVGNGVSPATLFLAGNGSHSFAAGGLIISANAALTGSGILGVTSVLPGGTISPGASIGTMSFSSPPSLLGATIMEIGRNGTVLTNDRIVSAGIFVYDGSLTVTNIGANALVAGDSFLLFGAGTYAGGLGSISLPPLSPGLSWTNKLIVSGTIEVLGLIGQTLPASGVASNAATLNGVVSPGGNNATAWFEWGTTTNYGMVTPPQALGGGTSNTNFSESLTGLATGVIHHFRVVASNAFGLVFGVNQSFSTPFPVPVLYFEDFDIDHTANWRVNRGPGDGHAEFHFDYSSIGIPSAPNSGGSTRGLKLVANSESDIFSGLSVSPLGEDFTGDYVLTFDIWWNFVGPAPEGGSGSTQVTGAGIGTGGTTPQWAGGVPDCVFFGATGDGGSPRDYRAYSTAAGSSYPEGSPVYAAPNGNINNTNAYYATLGGNTPPTAQTALFSQQTGTTAPGAPAFRWHAGKIVKDGSTITFSLGDLLIATINASTVTLSGGNILFNQFDVNDASSDDPSDFLLEFGLIDNVVVSRPNGLRLHRIARLANGLVQLTGSGRPGQSYTVEAASELTRFGAPGSEIGTAVADSSGVIFFVDPDPPTNPERYYRLRRP